MTSQILKHTRTHVNTWKQTVRNSEKSCITATRGIVQAHIDTMVALSVGRYTHTQAHDFI